MIEKAQGSARGTFFFSLFCLIHDDVYTRARIIYNTMSSISPKRLTGVSRSGNSSWSALGAIFPNHNSAYNDATSMSSVNKVGLSLLSSVIHNAKKRKDLPCTVGKSRALPAVTIKNDSLESLRSTLNSRQRCRALKQLTTSQDVSLSFLMWSSLYSGQVLSRSNMHTCTPDTFT